jgi:hypothetical protein
MILHPDKSTKASFNNQLYFDHERASMSVDMERSKQISVNELVKAAEKVWGEMPMVQIMLRDRMFQDLISRLAFHLGMVDSIYEGEDELPLP